jgi:hypothetical protein
MSAFNKSVPDQFQIGADQKKRLHELVAKRTLTVIE